VISNRTLVLGGIGLALGLAAFASPFASPFEDGLEAVATKHGIEAAEHPLWTASPIPDYAMPGVKHEGLATGSAGVVGTLVLLALGAGLGRMLVRRRS
jgi:hypothetical protein